MFLKQLSLTNIRCFGEAGISFDAPGEANRKWTVLLGENGTGKSTVLKATALVLAGSDGLIDLIVDPEHWIGSAGDEARIEVVIETAAGDDRQIALDFRRGEGISDFIGRSQKTLVALNDALAHAQRNYPMFGYGASRRLSASRQVGVTRPFRNVRARSVASLFDRHAELNPLEKWAMELDYRSDGTQDGMIKQVLSDFLPEIHFAHIDKQAGMLVFDTPDGMVPLAQLSDGYQNVAAWVGDLLYQITLTFDDYTNPLNARGLLIIDEIDLHLHPRWQRRLLDFLDQRLPRMQLLVTTHSLVTAQQSPEGALHYCVRRELGPVIEQFASDPGKLLLHQLLATEAFGRMSDESLEVERMKSEYRGLRDKAAQPDAAQADDDVARMAAIEATIDQMPMDEHALPVLTPEQQVLMRQILAAGAGEP